MIREVSYNTDEPATRRARNLNEAFTCELCNQPITQPVEGKMRKTIFVPVLCFLAVAFLLNGCGGKYADAKKLNEEYIELMETYTEEIEKAGSAKDVAKAMNRLADGLEKNWPKMQKLAEKYPELKDKNNPPEEMKASQERAKEVGKKMAGSFMKMMPYMNDPEVKKAQKRLSGAMSKK